MVLIIVVFGCYGFNCKSYKDNSAYEYYAEYAKVRSDIVDAPDYGYAEYESDLKKIGISQNDYVMLRKWNFSDPEYFTLEKLRKVSNIINKHKQWQGWQQIYENIQLRNYGTYPSCIACIILFIICVLWNPSNWIFYLITCGTGEFLILYFFIKERVLYRLEYSIFVSIFLMILYFFIQVSKSICVDKKMFKSILIINICCILVQLPIYIPDSKYKLIPIEDRKSYIDETFNASGNYDARKYRKVVNKKDLSNGLIENMKSKSKYVFLLDFNTTIQSLYYDWSPFESLGIDYYKNFCYLSGVTMSFPDNTQCLMNMGITNPLKDIVKEDVYLVDNVNSQIILNYLKEHYYPNATIKWIENVEGYDIWKITKE